MPLSEGHQAWAGPAEGGQWHSGTPQALGSPSQTKGTETWSPISVALVLDIQATRQIVPYPSCLCLASLAQGCLRTLLTQAALRSLQASVSCRKAPLQPTLIPAG